MDTFDHEYVKRAIRQVYGLNRTPTPAEVAEELDYLNRHSPSDDDDTRAYLRSRLDIYPQKGGTHDPL